MTPTTCSRCSNGWMVHPSGSWAVSCPACQPEDYVGIRGGRYWLEGGDGGAGSVRHHHELPRGHESQTMTTRPPWFVDVAREGVERARRRYARPTENEQHTLPEAS